MSPSSSNGRPKNHKDKILDLLNSAIVLGHTPELGPEDVLKIFENGRGRRTSVFLPEHVALWSLRAWADFTSPNPPIGVINCAKALVFFF